MSNMKTEEDFIKKIKQRLPCLIDDLELTVISEFKGIKNSLMLKDKYGEFFYKIVASIFARKNCDNTFIKVAINKENYIENYIKINNPNTPNCFKVIKYKDRRDILFDSEFGVCRSDLATLLNYSRTSIVFAEDKTSFFINQSKKKFPDKFTYDKTEFTGVLNNIILFCNKHKDYFNTFYSNHLNNGGCGICNRKGRYCNTISERNKELWKDEKLTLYFCKVFSEKETFYKIGLTATELKRRFTKITHIYSKELIYSIEVPKIKASEIEDYFKFKLPHKAYKPIHKFSGHTECFDFSKEEVLLIIKEMKNLK